MHATDPSTDSGLQPDAFGIRLTEAEYALFVRHGRARRAAPGAVLFRRGEPCRTLYVVCSGEIEVEADDERAPQRVRAGEATCEFGLLPGDMICVATGTARADSTLVELDAGDVGRLVDADAAALCSFLQRTFARSVQREQALVQRLRAHNATLRGALDRLQSTAEQLDRAQELVRTDELTGLPNRRGLERCLAERRDARTLDGVGVLLVDCDRFHAINDVYGHAAGDRLLQAVAHLLVSIAGTDDVVSRLGDDRFCVLVAATDRDAVMAQAECVVATVHGLMQVPHTPPLVCPLSIGACLLDTEGDWRSAHARAANALARAKQRGGNRVEWADAPG